MGTASAIAVICCLFISAALTVIVILVTIPNEDSDEPSSRTKSRSIKDGNQAVDEDGFQNRTDVAASPESESVIPAVDYSPFKPAEKIIHKLKNEVPQGLPVLSSSTTTTTAKQYSATHLEVENNFYLNPLQASTFRSVTAAKSSTALKRQDQQLISSQNQTTTRPEITASSKRTLGGQRGADSGRPSIVLKSELVRPATPRFLQQNLGAIKEQQHIEQLLRRDKSEVTVKRMELLSEVAFYKSGKIVGLAVESGLLYVATSDGWVRVLNPENGEQV